MSYIALDYGKKYIGIAKSDPDGSLAFPVNVITNNDKAVDTILNLITENKIEAVIIGDSVDAKGEKNEIAKWAEDFGNKIKEKTSLPIIYINESFTSNHARNAINDMKQGGRVDASAAALILQRFLDKNNKKINL